MNDILASVDILSKKTRWTYNYRSLLKDVPMIVPYYIPGQEEENLDFLSNCGVALELLKNIHYLYY